MSAWTVIAHTEVSSATQASITFSSIPATYTDLLIVYSIRTNRAANVDNLQLNINGQGVNTNITTRSLYGDGSAPDSITANVTAGGSPQGASSTSNTFTSGSIYFPNYAGSSNKSFSTESAMENNATYAITLMAANLWSQTAAITSIALDPQNSDIVQYSSATLYGITKGSSGGVSVS